MSIPKETQATIDKFLEHHSHGIYPIVCITSGGTLVALSSICSPFIDNFSLGERGANSAEYFLSKGYVVIYLYRNESRFPFMKNFHFHHHHRINDKLMKNVIFERQEEDEILRLAWNSVGLTHLQKELIEMEGKILRNITKFQNFLPISFHTVEDYLNLLEYVAKGLSFFGPRCCFYLAAAVSDFYIPSEQLFKLEETHQTQKKFPSEMVLNLSQVPKKLGVLTREWAPNSLIISFKLETDEQILLQKAEKAINSYSVHLVVANLLHSRRNHCILVSKKKNSETADASKENETENQNFLYDHVNRNENNELFIENQLIEKIVLEHRGFMREKYRLYFQNNPQGDPSVALSTALEATKDKATASSHSESAPASQAESAKTALIIDSFIDRMFEQKNSLICQQIQYYLTQTNTKQQEEQTSAGLSSRRENSSEEFPSDTCFSDYYFGRNPIPMLGGLCIMLSIIAVKEYIDTIHFDRSL